MSPKGKYKPFLPDFVLTDRQWPNRTITKSPIWCSVDLRDGNQSLPVPMSVEQKIEFFQTLVGLGFKEIEVGFPAASGTEFEFVRRLIEDKLIPEDVTIQVLVQAREDLIQRTVESLQCARRVIIHLYNSTSPSQRKIVFGLEKSDIVAMAVQGVRWVQKYSAGLIGTEVLLQYSPESFSATETNFAIEVCEAVMDVWCPTPQKKIILNLPDTVQVATPNVYADQIEWFCRHITRRDCVIISLHTHNDRGTGVAATELGILAGADRVEGTIYGNGERTGNVDLVTVALNMYTQGVDPGLDFSDLPRLIEVYERCTGMQVPPRHPYSGEFVVIALSGSHQDAIVKGLKLMARNPDGFWDVPYLHINPAHIGRKYVAVIRVNSQSGKAGIAHLLEHGCGIVLPKEMQREFGPIAGFKIDALGREVTAEDLRKMFWEEYVMRAKPLCLQKFGSEGSAGKCTCTAKIFCGNTPLNLTGEGNGPVDAFVNSLRNAEVADVYVLDWVEHAIGSGSDTQAIAYVKLRFPNNQICWGAGVDTNTELASINAIISAINRKIS